MNEATVNEGIEILVDGFFDNPVLAWVFPDESTRAEAIEAWYRFWLDYYGERGQLVVDGSGDGAALWAPPDVPPLDGEAGAGLFEVVRRYAGERAGVVLGAFAELSYPSERHWYLNAIAARRGKRARGIGARLLEPHLARADAEGVRVYLESSNPRNLTFYHRYGFEAHGPRIDLGGDGPPLQPMWRNVGGST